MFCISLFVKVKPYSLVSPKDTVVQSMSPGIRVPLFCSEGRYKPYHVALVCDLNWIAFYVVDSACLFKVMLMMRLALKLLNL
jgi:hypothetical protein